MQPSKLENIQVTTSQLDTIIQGLHDSFVFQSATPDTGVIVDYDSLPGNDQLRLHELVADIPKADYYHFYN